MSFLILEAVYMLMDSAIYLDLIVNLCWTVFLISCFVFPLGTGNCLLWCIQTSVLIHRRTKHLSYSTKLLRSYKIQIRWGFLFVYFACSRGWYLRCLIHFGSYGSSLPVSIHCVSQCCKLIEVFFSIEMLTRDRTPDFTLSYHQVNIITDLIKLNEPVSSKQLRGQKSLLAVNLFPEFSPTYNVIMFKVVHVKVE